MHNSDYQTEVYTMPRKRCPVCGDECGWFTWTEAVSEYPCPGCAKLNRVEKSRRDEHVLQKQVDDEEHARQMEITQEEVKAGIRRKEEEEETKRVNCEKQIKAACEQSREEQLTKRRKDDQDFEAAKLKVETERVSKMEVALEETKQFQLKYQTEIDKADRDYQIAQETTKQVKIQAEERTKQIELEQRTKQMMAEAEKLSHCASIVASLVEAGTDKAMIQSLLCKMLGAVELPPEKVGKVGTIPTISNSTTQSKFLESLTKESPKLSKRNNFPPSHSIRTAPV